MIWRFIWVSLPLLYLFLSPFFQFSFAFIDRLCATNNHVIDGSLYGGNWIFNFFCLCACSLVHLQSITAEVSVELWRKWFYSNVFSSIEVWTKNAQFANCNSNRRWARIARNGYVCHCLVHLVFVFPFLLNRICSNQNHWKFHELPLNCIYWQETTQRATTFNSLTSNCTVWSYTTRKFIPIKKNKFIIFYSVRNSSMLVLPFVLE